MIARGEQAMARLVEQDEGELSVHPVEEAVAEFFIEVDQDLDIGAGAEAVALVRQFVPQLPIIEYLAVADEEYAAVLVRQRLVAGRQVDDAQPAEAEPDAVIEKLAAIVRTPMRKRPCHGFDHVG